MQTLKTFTDTAKTSAWLLSTFILMGTALSLPDHHSLFKNAANAHSFSFWQLTDVHWDYLYNATGDPKKMCHPSSEYSISNSNTSYPYGTYSCETPWNLVELSIKEMAKINAHPDFILWTGDSTAHFEAGRDNFDWSVVYTSLKNISRILRETFPNTKIVPILGNHDAYLPNMYPAESSDFYQKYLTEGGFDSLLPEEESQNAFSQCGFYSLNLASLKIIVLNTNLYNIPDSYTSENPDPCSQFEWLESLLRKAEEDHTKVIITAHIPPGFFERRISVPFYKAEKNNRYVDLILRHGDIILAQFYGHTHTDSFRIMMDKSTKKIHSIAFHSPAISPWLFGGGINPGIRLYHATKDHVLDYWQYYLNLTTEGPGPNQIDPKWDLLYQATQTYDLPHLGLETMADLYRVLYDYPNVFEKYYFYNTVGHVFAACNRSCVQDHLCAISHLRTDEMEMCKLGNNLYLASASPYYSVVLGVSIPLILILIAFTILAVKFYQARISSMEMPLITRDDFIINY